MGSAPPIELLVIQPTSFCNIDCSYCYVPGRSDKRVAQFEMLERLTDMLLRSSRLPSRGQLEILWHAGEPLAAGLDFFERADRTLEKLSERVKLSRSFQTNATLLTPAWCRYFVDKKARVGVSIDGPRSIHNSHRKHRNGKGSFDAVMRGVALMKAHQIELSALAVLTDEIMGQPEELYSFFKDAGFTSVGFNVEETEGENSLSSLHRTKETRQKYTAFLRRFIELNGKDGNPLAIREIKTALHYLSKRSANQAFTPLEAEMEVGRILTVSRGGEIFSWSPELASGWNEDEAFFSLGNIFSVQSLDDVLDGDKAARIQKEVDAGRALCRQECEYFNVCGAGSPANKFYENGSFVSTETIKCFFQTQAVTDLLLDLASIKPRE